MSFDFHLYRAPPGLGPLNEWEEDHAEPLGSPAEVRQRVSQLFPALTWAESPDGTWRARGDAEAGEPIEVSFGALEGVSVQFIVTYAAPPTLRTLMTGLHLNYCCAPESGELRNPFAVGDTWAEPHVAP